MSFALHRAHCLDPMLVSWTCTALAVGYAAYLTYSTSKKPAAGGKPFNQDIKKDSPKVVDTIDVEDLGNKAVFLPLLEEQKFPYCDGSHGKYNEATGDNLGPLIIQDSKRPK